MNSSQTYLKFAYRISSPFGWGRRKAGDDKRDLVRIWSPLPCTPSLCGRGKSVKAIFFVSSAVALGYMVLPFAGFSLWTRLGVLTALIISISALTTLTVIPSLALIIRPRFLARSRKTSPAEVLPQHVAVGGRPG